MPPGTCRSVASTSATCQLRLPAFGTGPPPSDGAVWAAPDASHSSRVRAPPLPLPPSCGHRLHTIGSSCRCWCSRSRRCPDGRGLKSKSTSAESQLHSAGQSCDACCSLPSLARAQHASASLARMSSVAGVAGRTRSPPLLAPSWP
eukprot:scaffold28748_cov64-Phaeocystis_antarctica.AAC.6